MHRSLFLLILMGRCSFFTCQLYEYHFIGDPKTWNDAQAYCKSKYTDLATVSNISDVESLCCESTTNQGEAWIGLYNQANANRMWHWSLPGVEYHEDKDRWSQGEPNDEEPPENCAMIKSTKWVDVPCSQQNNFICYDEKKKDEKNFHFIDKKKTWLQAQNYCRQRHTDLVSGPGQLDDDEFKSEIKSAVTFMWIGLFRDRWRWSDGSSFSFRHWAQSTWEQENNNPCAVMQKNGRWKDEDCNLSKPFFCINDKVILIKQNKTWEEALRHCRENHNDLISITTHDEQRWVQERAKKADTPYVWLGLRYTCTLDFWFWVSDEAVHYKNWVSDVKTDDCDMSGAMDRGGEHKWFKRLDDEKFNFMCSMC